MYVPFEKLIVQWCYSGLIEVLIEECQYKLISGEFSTLQTLTPTELLASNGVDFKIL